MKLNKILIPTISLIGLTSVIPTVACTKSKEEKDSFPFELDTDITDIKVDENYDRNSYDSSDNTVCLYYSNLEPIKISYKNGKKFKETDHVSV
ncbi:MAG: hypothetical protein MJ200_00375 [Mycoplasmoidaceae bacterium]|nr:hypothetical protein [Mycoplasmoidaceae bacterium]